MSADYTVQGDLAVITINNPPINGMGFEHPAGHRGGP